MLEFEEDDIVEVNGDTNDDFFDIEERDPESDQEKHVVNGEKDAKKLSVNAAEWVPPVRVWKQYEGTDMKWIKNDQVFSQPESRYRKPH